MTKTSTNTRTRTQTVTRVSGPAALLALLAAGCGPSFDPASLIETTRVVGARVEVAGAPDRAMPQPGETATVTWLVTAPAATPPLGWAFAVCAPGTMGGKASLSCTSVPLAVFQGTEDPPRLSIAVPTADVLPGAASLLVYGRICPDSAPTFDPESGTPACVGGAAGTTASVTIPLQLGTETNHNPTADRAFTFDGQPWPALAAGTDPCVVGPMVASATDKHIIGTTTAGTDRESYTTNLGDPPVPTTAREALQISHFTTAGKLKTQFAFVEATDGSAETTVEVEWNAPKAADVPAGGLPVTFTFVVRDGRGGTDWATRAACVAP